MMARGGGGVPLTLQTRRIREGVNVKRQLSGQRHGTSLAVQWLGLGTLTAEGPGSIPGRGTEIPRAMWHRQKKKKKKTMAEVFPFQSRGAGRGRTDGAAVTAMGHVWHGWRPTGSSLADLDLERAARCSGHRTREASAPLHSSQPAFENGSLFLPQTRRAFPRRKSRKLRQSQGDRVWSSGPVPLGLGFPGPGAAEKRSRHPHVGGGRPRCLGPGAGSGQAGAGNQ